MRSVLVGTCGSTIKRKARSRLKTGSAAGMSDEWHWRPGIWLMGLRRLVANAIRDAPNLKAAQVSRLSGQRVKVCNFTLTHNV